MKNQAGRYRAPLRSSSNGIDKTDLVEVSAQKRKCDLLGNHDFLCLFLNSCPIAWRRPARAEYKAAMQMKCLNILI